MTRTHAAQVSKYFWTARECLLFLLMHKRGTDDKIPHPIWMGSKASVVLFPFWNLHAKEEKKITNDSSLFSSYHEQVIEQSVHFS